MLGAYSNPMTSLVGRDREIAEVVALLGSSRLVTLTGPGGTGKTRLALAVAHAISEDGAEVSFVDLAALDDGGRVLAAILASLGLRATAEKPPLDLLAARIGRLILLLDNFEHVASAAPHLSELLARCPDLKALVTSRSRLHVSPEVVYEVPPLAVPPSSERAEALAGYGSVRLFMDRASEAGGAPARTPGELAVVAEICRRLEGLPLAIELAASRARHLSSQALLARLERPLPLLSGGPIDVPARHRALRHTIAWSYDLLTPDLAAFFADLGVFEGAFGLEAAHVVAGARVGGSEMETLDAVTSLVDQSLLRSVPSDDEAVRFVMHEAISDFAVSVSGDEPALRERHLGYYVELAERAESELEGAEQARWTRVVADDLENFRGALRWAYRSSSTVALLRLAAALGDFWRWHGDLREGREWLSRALLAAHPGREALVAKAQRRAARIFNSLGERDQARLLLESSRVNAEASGDADGVAEALIAIGGILMEEGRQAEAVPYVEEGLERARSDGSVQVVAHATLMMALLQHSQGRTGDAVPLYEEAARMARGIGNLRLAAVALVNLADTKLIDGDYAAAVPLLTVGIEDLDQAGDMAFSQWANLVLGLAQRRLGRMEAARLAIDRGARLALTVDSPVDMILAAEVTADWLGAAGAHREALTAWAAASYAREDQDIPRLPTDDAWIDEGIDRDRRAAGKSEAAAAWSAARDVGLRAAVTGALELLGLIPLGTPAPAGRDRYALTVRETEVLALLARGLSDGRIAEELYISPKTASVHVASIKGKLGASSRVEIVTNAVRMGLVTIPDEVAT